MFQDPVTLISVPVLQNVVVSLTSYKTTNFYICSVSFEVVSELPISLVTKFMCRHYYYTIVHVLGLSFIIYNKLQNYKFVQN